jgi:hypothetical protein
VRDKRRPQLFGRVEAITRLHLFKDYPFLCLDVNSHRNWKGNKVIQLISVAVKLTDAAVFIYIVRDKRRPQLFGRVEAIKRVVLFIKLVPVVDGTFTIIWQINI